MPSNLLDVLINKIEVLGIIDAGEVDKIERLKEHFGERSWLA